VNRKLTATLLALLPLVALVLYYFLTTPTAGDFWWYDSPRHAMNGVFLRDFVMEGGLLHPIRFASSYYEQYPGINIGFYPPFFYMTSVPFLMLFGASHAVSQAVVALYALGLGVVVVLLCRRLMDQVTASAVALCVLLLAPIALWSRQVQLDVPALALFAFTAYALIRHLDDGKQTWLFVAAAALGLSVLTRVQGVFMAPVWLYFIFIRPYPARPTFGRRVLATLLAGVIALPAIAMAVYFARVNKSLATAMPGMPSLWSVGNWTWYARMLPSQLTWPGVAFLLAGLAAAVWLGYRRQASLEVKVIAAFGVCAWLFFTVVSNKDPRFNLPGAVFLFVLAACALRAAHATAARVVVPALAVWLVAHLFVQQPVPYVRGYEQAAAVVAKIAPPSSNVLVSAHRDGNFIYDLRTQAARRDIGVVRADKALVEIKIVRELGVHDNRLSQDDILALLDKHKVETVVLQSGYLAEQGTIQNLFALLQDHARFETVTTIPMVGDTNRDEKQIVVYRRVKQAVASR
jgi:hypothetical protein